jgi:hypothetical protein
MDETIALITHNRQFLLSPSPDSPRPGWISRSHGPFWLHNCPLLSIRQGQTADGVPATLLGLAAQQQEGRPNPSEVIGSTTSHALPAQYATWAGRWVLLLGDTLHLDASGNLGVFYTMAGGGLISSSPALLSELENLPAEKHQLVHAFGVDWYTGPLTRIKRVSRLLPSQILHLSRQQVQSRPLLMKVETNDVADSLARALITAMINLQSVTDRFYLPLTAGLDSRTVLAAARAAGISPITYTFNKPGISQADRELPPQLAENLGLDHHLLERGRYSANRRALFDAHSAAHCVDIDRKYYAHGQWQEWADDGIILRGGCFEFGRNYYDSELPQGFSESATALHHALGRNWWAKSQPLVQQGLAKWLAWAGANPESRLDFRDRLYLEQRLGGWLSSIEQALDITGTERIHTANSTLVYSLLNIVPRDERASGKLQKEVIRRLCPALAEFPYNAPDSRLHQLRRKLTNQPEKMLQILMPS